MQIVEARERSEELVQKLVAVWERSVRATHHFLTEADIARIKGYVPQALRGVETLVVAEEAPGAPLGFMGIEGDSLEMLFLAPEARGRGLGRRLLERGIACYAVRRLAVNEQNPAARGFYEHLGFVVYKRTTCDEQGEPYPLLYLRLPGEGEEAPARS